MTTASLARVITTDRRHIDPNPDRLAFFPTTTTTTSSRSTSNSPQPVSSTSLLLLSTSAEAAVLESKRFERGSRQSSVAASIGSPPPLLPLLEPSTPPPPPPPPQQQPASSAPTSFRTLAHSPLRPHHLHHHRLHSHHLHHLSISNHHHGPALSITGTNKREIKNGHLFKCEKCPKVYRHPQCLVKHRWEHTSYWADASKLMLSKHQQVQMLEAAAILAAPSGSLPESRSLWPAAVSPSEAGLLGSDQVNLDVIRSQARPAAAGHHHSASVPCTSTAAVTDAEMSIGAQTDHDGEKAEQEEEDEIMFEMSLDSDERTPTPPPPQRLPPRTRPTITIGTACSISAPPPMGYFEKRTERRDTGLIKSCSSSSTTTSQARVPAMVAYKPFERFCGSISVYHPETIFKPIKPYADSELRFEGRLKEQGKEDEIDEAESTEEEDEGCSDGFENGDEVIGMEL